MTTTDPESRPPSPDRRSFLRAAGTAAACAALGRAPYVFARDKITLRVMGTHVTLREDIRRRAMNDLGFDVHFEAGGDSYVLQKASMHPESFDLYEQWSNSLNVLWRAKAVQPIERRRIRLWDEINDLVKTGRLTPGASIGLGDAPYKLLYVQADGRLDSAPSEFISFLPYVHNVDSFGYNTQAVPLGKPYVTESWGWLLDERWRGKVALVNAPDIGLFDAALAAEAQGLMTFGNIGNMTKEEINRLFAILIDKKQQGHFSGFWNSVPESVDYMVSGRAVISSMFSPAASTLNGLGVPVIYAAPKEGYRAWYGVMCLSSRTEGRVKDAAYEYMNWWLSGWPGAYVARQGYYISVPQRARPHLSPAEWDYWYEGKPAAHDLRSQEGTVAVRAGSVRTGGSYVERFSHVAVWNTIMDTYEYSLPRWHEFLLA
jgi:putative spermidine/putrescine transport system substrate-binding protein